MALIIGIDPGKTGAVAVILTGNPPVVYVIRDTPILNGEYDIIGMANMLENIGEFYQPDGVFIEKVHSMPGQGVASMFNFGMGYGMWLGVIAALKLPYSLVTPQSWKKELMEGKKEKDDARMRAMELYPKAHDLLYRKKDIGRADALLIAEYGRRKLYGNNKL